MLLKLLASFAEACRATKIVTLPLLVTLLCLVNIDEAPAAEPPPPKGTIAGRNIRRVHIEGNKVVATETVLARLRTRPGAAIDTKLLDEDARRIILMPQIYDVSWQARPIGDEVEVVFAVTEAPRIAAVSIIGNKRLKIKKLKKQLSVKAGDFIDLYLLKQGTETLLQEYRKKGYYFATVELDREMLQREGKVIYRVVEGPHVRISKVKFQGHQSVKKRKLKARTKTRSYAPVFRKGRLDDEQLELDRLTLESHYRAKGFNDARVDCRTRFNKPKTRATVAFVIEEGPQYRLAKLRFKGNERFSRDELLELIPLKVNDVLTSERRMLTERAIKRHYGREGYVYARVATESKYTDRQGWLDVLFDIEENNQYHLGRLQVEGNYQTRDKVIRRAFDHFGFLPGRLYDDDAAERARRRLLDLRYFEDVSVMPIGADPNVRDALVKVTEGQTGMVIFGAAVGTDSGVVGQLAYREQNFDIGKWPHSFAELFSGEAFSGGGQRLELDFWPGTEVTRGRIRFHEPYLFDQPYYLNVDLFLFRRWRESYLERRRGGSVTLGRRFDNDWSVDLSIRGEQVRVTELKRGQLDPADPNFYIIAPQDVVDVAGSNCLTSIKLGIGRNRTNSLFRPSQGYKFHAGWEQVGVLGGDFSYAVASAGGSVFHTVYEDITERKTIWASQLRGSNIIGDAPLFERYYLGGIGSLRGFDFREVSPRASTPPRQDNFPIGSDYMLIAATELTHPLYEEVIFAKLFCDSAIISEGPYRVTVGLGIELLLPQLFQMVPMQFNFAFPLKYDDKDEREVFSFSLGMGF